MLTYGRGRWAVYSWYKCGKHMHLGNVHSVSDNIWTGWKFVCLGVSFKRNHLNRTKIQTFGRSKFRVNGQKILNGPVWTKCPVKYSGGRKFVRSRVGTKRGQNLCTRCRKRESICTVCRTRENICITCRAQEIYPPCAKREKIYAMSA